MSDDLTLIVGDRRLSGWTEVRVTRGVERCPSDFDITMTELYPGESTAFVVQPGDPCQVKIGDDLVITGYVDRLAPSVSPYAHALRLIGRGKCQDLVDCAAEWPGGQISGSSVLGIAKKLAQPYGIEVSAASFMEAAKPVPQFNLMEGETAFEIIERLCRWSGLLAYDLPDGSLHLSRVGTDKAASGFTQGANVQSANAVYSMDQRFSEYLAFRQSLDILKDLGEGGNLIFTAYDKGVPRHRRRVIIAESIPGNPDQLATRRAQWEAARRWGRSAMIRVTTDSWRDSAGALWTPNTLTTIDIPAVKTAQKEWVISEVTFKRDTSGTTADLTLVPPSALEPQPTLLFPIYPDLQPGAA